MISASEKYVCLTPHSDSFSSYPLPLPDKPKLGSQGEVKSRGTTISFLLVWDEGRSDKYIFIHIETWSICFPTLDNLHKIKKILAIIGPRTGHTPCSWISGDRHSHAKLCAAANHTPRARADQARHSFCSWHDRTISHLGEQTNFPARTVNHSSRSSSRFCTWLRTSKTGMG